MFRASESSLNEFTHLYQRHRAGIQLLFLENSGKRIQDFAQAGLAVSASKELSNEKFLWQFGKSLPPLRVRTQGDSGQAVLPRQPEERVLLQCEFDIAGYAGQRWGGLLERAVPVILDDAEDEPPEC